MTDNAIEPDVSCSAAFRSNVDQWPVFNRYQPLDFSRNEIRLLDLELSDLENRITCRLKHTSLDAKPKYKALSYYWGAPVPKDELRTILVNDIPVLLRPTLWDFLHTLLNRSQHLTVWLDVLCINQRDDQEKGQQVSLMGRIFSTATSVFSWLGQADADSRYAFEVANVDKSLPGEDLMLYQCWDYLFSRPYWTRMWVLQEFSLAFRITLVCGKDFIAFDEVRPLLKRISRQGSASNGDRMDIFCAMRPEPAARRLLGDNILDCVHRFASYRCVDMHDKVYALFNIIQDKPSLIPSYERLVADLFFDLLSIMHTYRGQKHTDIEQHENKYACAYLHEPLHAAVILYADLQLRLTDLFDAAMGADDTRLYCWLWPTAPFRREGVKYRSFIFGEQPLLLNHMQQLTDTATKYRRGNRPSQNRISMSMPSDSLTPERVVFTSAGLSESNDPAVFSMKEILRLGIYRCTHNDRVQQQAAIRVYGRPGHELAHLTKAAHFVLMLITKQGLDPRVFGKSRTRQLSQLLRKTKADFEASQSAAGGSGTWYRCNCPSSNPPLPLAKPKHDGSDEVGNI